MLIAILSVIWHTDSSPMLVTVVFTIASWVVLLPRNIYMEQSHLSCQMKPSAVVCIACILV